MSVNDERHRGGVRGARVSILAVLLCGVGCDALGEPVDERLARAPKDTRPPITADRPPPPISGGTLMTTADDRYAIASDPDRDQIYVVSLASGTLEHRIELERGDEPGRLVEGADGRVHVALRGSGEIATIHAESGELLTRRAVCNAPRGMAFDGATLQVHVACADGRVVSFDEMSATPLRVVETTEGLRDVMLRQGALLVSRFKTAELLSVTDDGRLESVVRGGELLPLNEQGSVDAPMSATTAWKTVSTPTGRVVMVHQRATEAEVDLEPSSDAAGVEGDSPYGGSAFGNSCDGIVHAAVTEVSEDGQVHSTLPLMGTVLPVDVAAWGEWVAVADAGSKDPEAPVSQPFFDEEGFSRDFLVLSSGSSLSLVHVEELQRSPEFPAGGGCVFPQTIPLPEMQMTSVAFTSGGTLLAQSREPARLVVVDVAQGSFAATGTIELDERSVRDTGHDVFHRDAGQGIACASCHPEGGDDGHTWHFEGSLPRRTQSLFVNLSKTLPLHWAGDIQDVAGLMDEVFVGRMGGAKQSPERLDALDSWLNDFPSPSPALAADDPAVQRGEAIFRDANVGCAACHSGSQLTDNRSYDVGTGELAQVPSLVGLAYRAPFMRSGCATTLHERFEATCGGGDAHGHTSQLAAADIDDLVAYLRSL